MDKQKKKKTKKALILKESSSEIESDEIDDDAERYFNDVDPQNPTSFFDMEKVTNLTFI